MKSGGDDRAPNLSSGGVCPPIRVAVIGAGVAGLAAAGVLRSHGLAVRVFDKARGPGGRISTRRESLAAGEVLFDHGAQYFTARSEGMQRQAEAWHGAGVIAPWPSNLATLETGNVTSVEHGRTRWAGIGGMSSLARHLSREGAVECGCTVSSLRHDAAGWELELTGGVRHGPFAALVVTAPAAQTAALLRDLSPLAHAAAEAVMSPCWALMVATDGALAPKVRFEAARVRDSALSWLARDHGKPGRTNPAGLETWVAHASPTWSREHLELEPADAAAALLDAFRRSLGLASLTGVVHSRAHRWRFAQVERPLGQPCLFDAERMLVAAGDWCTEGRIEGAFLSGTAAAEKLIEAMGPSSAPVARRTDGAR